MIDFDTLTLISTVTSAVQEFVFSIIILVRFSNFLAIMSTATKLFGNAEDEEINEELTNSMNGLSVSNGQHVRFLHMYPVYLALLIYFLLLRYTMKIMVIKYTQYIHGILLRMELLTR